VNLMLALDPGTIESGWVLYAHKKIIDSGVMDNEDLCRRIAAGSFGLTLADAVAIEMVESFGMAVGVSTFRTVWWSGRFAQAWMARSGKLPIEITRKQEKLHLCQSMKAKDKNIRQALIDRFGEPGTKKNPGGTYGVRSHAWSALAVAATAWDIAMPEARAA
jgi:hypothetical protein